MFATTASCPLAAATHGVPSQGALAVTVTGCLLATAINGRIDASVANLSAVTAGCPLAAATNGVSTRRKAHRRNRRRMRD
ncbi:hypothetical protein [Paraburkholderia terricola]|uniref:hypothetical protein n=1 Tax=Paraburkholderia terricola TaxID=169427 RepID=UPI0012602CD1|nr:hypothetical protein [Paraburkholderia terricola]